VRAVLGDVQGHGLAAVATVASLLGAFREAVLDQPDLESVAARLDRRLAADSVHTAHAELFATAVLVEFTADASGVRALSCGHPPPVLLRDGTVTELGVEPWLPLGLALPDGSAPRASALALRPGDRLLLVSDGVLEARDASGAFYPLPERLAGLTGAPLTALTEGLWADLAAYCADIEDDVTMLALAPRPPRDR
jgi:serine phosphatase RsbU (regulator of sigma subunit)